MLRRQMLPRLKLRNGRQLLRLIAPPLTIAPTTNAPLTIAPLTIAPTTIAPRTIAPVTLSNMTNYENVKYIMNKQKFIYTCILWVYM